MLNNIFSKINIKYTNQLKLKNIIINITAFLLIIFSLSNVIASIIYNDNNKKASLADAITSAEILDTKKSLMFSEDLMYSLFLNQTDMFMKSKQKIYKNNILSLKENNGKFHFHKVNHKFYIKDLEFDKSNQTFKIQNGINLYGAENDLKLTIDDIIGTKKSEMKDLDFLINKIHFLTKSSRLQINKIHKKKSSYKIFFNKITLKTDNLNKDLAFYSTKVGANNNEIKKIHFQADELDYDLAKKAMQGNGNIKISMNHNQIESDYIKTVEFDENDVKIINIKKEINKNNSKIANTNFKNLMFKGNVKFISDKYNIKSNFIYFDSMENYLYAYDDLKIQSEDNYISGYFFIYNLRTDEGFFLNKYIYEQMINEKDFIDYAKIQEFLKRENLKKIFNVDQERKIENQISFSISQDVRKSN